MEINKQVSKNYLYTYSVLFNNHFTLDSAPISITYIAQCSKNPKKVQFWKSRSLPHRLKSIFFDFFFKRRSPKRPYGEKKFFFQKTLILAFEVIVAQLTYHKKIVHYFSFQKTLCAGGWSRLF